MVMPMLIATAGTPKEAPICGSDVEMIVESSSCMKKAMATISATRRAFVAVSDEASVSGMAVMTDRFEQHLGGSVHR